MAKEEIGYLGALPLFLGTETESWTLAQFKQAALNAKALGVTSLLVKVADGTSMWYGGMPGINSVLNAIKTSGINAVPYMYCYGNLFNAIAAEINILSTFLSHYGIVIADLEAEFNNHADWAARMTSSLLSIPGIFGVTTWANPFQQQWQNVFIELAPCVNFWLPQVYTDYLASIYQGQYDQFHVTYYPVLNLATDFGPNNILQIAQNAHTQVRALWEYSNAINTYAPIVKNLASLYTGGTMVVPTGWSYDSGKKVLTAANGILITEGFCQWVLNNNWESDNLPLTAAIGLNPVELGNPTLGGGTVQPFRKKILVWTSQTSVYEMWVGQEYIQLYNERRTLTAQLTTDQAKIVDLEKAIATLTNLQQVIAILQSATNEVGQISNSATAVKQALQQIISSL